MKKLLSFLLVLVLTLSLLVGCGTRKETILIYSGMEEYRNVYLSKRLSEEFPTYNIVVEYMPTGNLAAKIQAEGVKSDVDIIVDIDYSYASLIEDSLADLSPYDQSIFCEDMQVESGRYIPMTRNGGAVVVNLDVLKEKGLKEPTCYEDLLNPEFKSLISMPDPKSSGTGYMFLKSLVNAWSEDEAFAYFDNLSENILQFTSSGSGPVNALIQGEVAVGLGMTSQAVTAINNGSNLKILYFDEGSPSSLYGYSILKGKETRKEVVEVFDFIYNTYVNEDKAQFYPEQIYKDKTFEIEGYPTDIQYADMSNNTTEEKQRLLDKWSH